MGKHPRDRALRWKRSRPREELEREAAERIDVRSRGELRLDRKLKHRLRRHVLGCSDELLAVGSLLTEEQTGDPQIRDSNAEVFSEQEVARLQITVHRVGGVNRGDPAAGLVEDLEGELQIRREGQVAPAEPIVDRLPADELRHEVGDPLVLAEGVNREHIGVIHARHCARLGEEALAKAVAEELGPNELDRDVSLELLVVRAQDDSHPPAPERFDDPVRAADESSLLEAKH